MKAVLLCWLSASSFSTLIYMHFFLNGLFVRGNFKSWNAPREALFSHRGVSADLRDVWHQQQNTRHVSGSLMTQNNTHDNGLKRKSWWFLTSVCCGASWLLTGGYWFKCWTTVGFERRLRFWKSNPSSLHTGQKINNRRINKRLWIIFSSQIFFLK